MKILMVSCAALPYRRSGVSTAIYNLSRTLCTQGHQIGIFTLSDQENFTGMRCESVDNVTYFTMPYAPEFPISDARNFDNPDFESAFQACLSAFSPQAVHFHSIQGLGVGLVQIAHEAGCRTVITMHDWWWICPRQFPLHNSNDCMKHQRYDRCLSCIDIEDQTHLEFFKRREQLLGKALNLVHTIVCVSDYVLQNVTARYPNLASRLNSFGLGVFAEPPTRWMRTQNQLLRFGFVGGVEPIKGYPLVMKAFSELSGHSFDLKIYGTMFPTRANAFLRLKKLYASTDSLSGFCLTVLRKIKKYTALSKGGNINHLPPFSYQERWAVYSQIDVLIQASTVKESYSFAVREAMSAGCCVITTKCGGPEAVVFHGQNGLVLEEATSSTLLEAVVMLLNDRSYTWKLQQNAFTKAQQFLTHTQCAEFYLKCYEGRIRL